MQPTKIESQCIKLLHGSILGNEIDERKVQDRVICQLTSGNL